MKLKVRRFNPNQELNMSCTIEEGRDINGKYTILDIEELGIENKDGEEAYEVCGEDIWFIDIARYMLTKNLVLDDPENALKILDKEISTLRGKLLKAIDRKNKPKRKKPKKTTEEPAKDSISEPVLDKTAKKVVPPEITTKLVGFNHPQSILRIFNENYFQSQDNLQREKLSLETFLSKYNFDIENCTLEEFENMLDKQVTYRKITFRRYLTEFYSLKIPTKRKDLSRLEKNTEELLDTLYDLQELLVLTRLPQSELDKAILDTIDALQDLNELQRIVDFNPEIDKLYEKLNEE